MIFTGQKLGQVAKFLPVKSFGHSVHVFLPYLACPCLCQPYTSLITSLSRHIPCNNPTMEFQYTCLHFDKVCDYFSTTLGIIVPIVDNTYAAHFPIYPTHVHTLATLFMFSKGYIPIAFHTVEPTFLGTLGGSKKL